MNTKRIKEIHESTAYPESRSVQQALLQVWNECEQNDKQYVKDLEIKMQEIYKLLDELIVLKNKNISN